MTLGRPSSREQRPWQAPRGPPGTCVRSPWLALLWGLVERALSPSGASQAEGSGGTRALPLLHPLVPGWVPPALWGRRFSLHLGRAETLSGGCGAGEVGAPGCLAAHSLSSQVKPRTVRRRSPVGRGGRSPAQPWGGTASACFLSYGNKQC